MNRSQARENAMKILFQLEVKEPLTINEAKAFITDENDDFMMNIAEGVKSHEEQIDSLIAPHLKHWTFERLTKIDRTLLRMAIYEIEYTDVPDKVAVNEIINLAKQYGDDDSYKFINGVLSEVIKMKE